MLRALSASSIPAAVLGRHVSSVRPDASHEPGDHVLSKCARALLNVPRVSRRRATDSQISALSGYRKTSSGFTNALSEVRTRGLIDGPKERRVITDTGRGVTGEVAPMPTGPALLGHWLPKLGSARRRCYKPSTSMGRSRAKICRSSQVTR